MQLSKSGENQHGDSRSRCGYGKFHRARVPEVSGGRAKQGKPNKNDRAVLTGKETCVVEVNLKELKRTLCLSCLDLEINNGGSHKI